jgi:predicted PurR-regulated permease PerM
MSKAKVNNMLKILIITVLVICVVILISPFLLSLAIGSILSVVVFPLYIRMINHKWNPHLAAFTTVLVFNLVFLVPTTLVALKGAASTFKFVSETLSDGTAVNEMISEEHAKLKKAQVKVNEYTAGFGIKVPDFTELTKNAITTVGTFMVNTIKQLFAQIPELFLGLFIITLAMYFCLIEHQKAREMVLKYCLLNKERGERLIHSVLVSCKSVILANLIAGGVQALLVGTGAYFSGTGDFFIVIFITFVFSFVPVIGAAPVAFVLAGVAGLQHEYGACLAMVIVGLVAGISDNFIRPLILSEAAETHALMNLLTILGGVILFGLPGLFIGPLVLSLAVSLVPIYQEEIDP